MTARNVGSRQGERTKIGRDAVGSCHHFNKSEFSIGEKKAPMIDVFLLQE